MREQLPPARRRDVRALLIDCDGVDFGPLNGRAIFAGVDAVHESIAKSVLLVVLGMQCVATQYPRETAEALDHFGGVVLLAASGEMRQCAVLWERHRVGAVVHPGRVGREAVSQLQERRVARLSPREWIGPRLDELGAADRAVLRVRRRIDTLTARAWADACLMTPRGLRRLTMRAIGSYPRDGLREYRVRGARDRQAPTSFIGVTCYQSLSRG